MVSILGSDGACALRKAAERSPEVEAVLVPRSVLAWINLIGRDDYEGDLPGVVDTSLTFKKSEDTYTGSITIGNDQYTFDHASSLHLASAVAVALGVDAESFDPALKDLDLARLGKSIDLLVKAHSVTSGLDERHPCSVCGEKFATKGKKSDKWFCRRCPEVDKTEAPGPAHMATPPGAPTAGQPATMQALKGPPTPKAPKALKITKSQSERRCGLCGFAQFKAGRFNGCLCFRDLSKSVNTVPDGDGYLIELKGWDNEALLTLIESLGSK